MKSLLCILALLGAPALAQEVATAPVVATPIPPIPSVTLDKGLIVTPVVVPFDSLRSMLGAQLWRYNVKASAPDTNVIVRFEVRTTGQKPEIWPFPLGVIKAGETELTFGLLPQGGTGLSDADTWRFNLSTRNPVNEPNNTVFNGGWPNPLKDFNSTQGTAEYIHPQGDYIVPETNGDIILKGYVDGTKEKPITKEIVLVLADQKPQSKN